jgi:hypothetical protein
VFVFGNGLTMKRLIFEPKSGSWLNLRPVIYDGGQPTVGIHAGWMRSGGKS